MTNIAIFASGNGSNAERIAAYFASHERIRVCMILSNKVDAFVLKRADALGIPSMVFDRKRFYESSDVQEKLKAASVDFLVLAGFLWLVPGGILEGWEKKILNIHPALLPKFGGKGMYGMNVHKAVIESGEKESGITIHYVNACYDEGDVVFQARCPVIAGDTPETLAGRIHELEYRYYPEVIERVISTQ